MGFRQNAYARIFYVNNKGKYSVGNIVVSKKNKDTGIYEPEFQSGLVRFVGDAHEVVQTLGLPTKESYNKDIHKGAPIKITSCDVTNKYDAAKNTTYWNCTVFGLEDANSNNSGNANSSAGKSKPTQRQHIAEPDDDVQLPF